MPLRWSNLRKIGSLYKWVNASAWGYKRPLFLKLFSSTRLVQHTTGPPPSRLLYSMPVWPATFLCVPQRDTLKCITPLRVNIQSRPLAQLVPVTGKGSALWMDILELCTSSLGAQRLAWNVPDLAAAAENQTVRKKSSLNSWMPIRVPNLNKALWFFFYPGRSSIIGYLCFIFTRKSNKLLFQISSEREGNNCWVSPYDTILFSLKV